MKDLSAKMILDNKYGIPCVGFGTWQTPYGDVAISSVKEAIQCGYRHIDTAACYENEESVGIGIKEGIAAAGLYREDIFITSKVWNTERGFTKTKAAFHKTLSDLGVEYLDLYLIHWPANARQFGNWEEINSETWRAVTTLYKEGKIKAVGVSNFLPHHLKPLMEGEIKPMVNQIEYHPGQMQEDVVDFCKNNGILVEAWSPLGTGRMLKNQTLLGLSKKYEKSVAQLCIRWCLQNGVLPLPKSVTPTRIQENAEIFDFEISVRDMSEINAMEYFGGSGLNPDTIDF